LTLHKVALGVSGSSATFRSGQTDYVSTAKRAEKS
jgi:hypothetical protein